MPNAEHTEQMRQVIMRYRELLDLLQAEMAQGEQRYARLFAALSADERALPEKARQRAAALHAIESPKPLQDALLHMRFVMRDMEREFEAAYDHTLLDADSD